MRILHLTNLYAPSIGGVQSHVRWLSEGFAARGDEVTVFTSNALDDGQFYQARSGDALPAGSTSADGVRIRRFPIRYGLHRALFGPGGRRLPKRGPLRSFGKRPFCPDAALALARLAPDIAVAFNAASSFSHYAAWARRARGTPFLLVPALHTGAGWAQESVTAWVLRTADLVAVYTERERDAVVDLGVPEPRVRVIPLGIDARASPAADAAGVRARAGLGEGPVVGYVGRQTAGKGVGLLIRAMGRVLERHPDAQLLLAGPLPAGFEAEREQALRALAPAARARVALLDAFEEAEKASIFAACDVVAVPSETESFGLVYLEAWIQERPVIALAGTAPATFIAPGEDGLLAPPADPLALAECISTLLVDPQLRARLGRAGRAKTLARFTRDHMLAATRAAYAELTR